MKKIALLLFSCSLVQAEVSLDTMNQRYSYSLGVKMAQLFKNDPNLGKNVDVDALMLGVRDVMSGQKVRLTEDQMAEARKHHFIELRRQWAKDNLKESQLFLAENAKKPEIKTLPSGVQYEVLKSGKGPTPQLNDQVKVHYEGKLTTGARFDSSYERGRPAIFKVNGVIKGFSEALQHMKVGDKWRVFIPPQLGYGERGAGHKIGPNRVLIFEIELLDIVSK